MNQSQITQKVNAAIGGFSIHSGLALLTNNLDEIRASAVTVAQKVEFRDAIKAWFLKSIPVEILDELEVYVAKFVHQYL